MASTSKTELETEVKAEVEENVADVLANQFANIVGVTADGDDNCDGDGDDDCDGDGDGGDDDYFSAAIEAILPICGRCKAGPCRYGITDSGRVFLKCCIKEGFGACGFFKWLDPQQIAESQKRIHEIAKKQQGLAKKQG